MIVLATVIAVDPAVTGGSSEARRAAADVLFVVDTTSSMAALDYGVDAPRLDGVRADIVELAAEFPGAHFSLIRFDSQARLELPWTTDLGALETAVSVLRQERALYSRGSRLDLPLQVIDEQLPRPSAATGDDGSYSVVFYFSDGEVRRGAETEDPAVDRQTGMVLPDDDDSQLGDQLVRRAGAGRRRWRRVRLRHRRRGADARSSSEPTRCSPLRTRQTDSPYVLDYATEQTAISRLDEDNLVEIADELGVPYLHRGEPGGLSAMAAALANAAPTVSDGSRETPRRLYWIPAARAPRRAAVAGGGDGQGGDGDATYPRRSGQGPAAWRGRAGESPTGVALEGRGAGGMSGPAPAGRRSPRRFLVLPLVAVLLAVGVKLVTMFAFAAAWRRRLRRQPLRVECDQLRAPGDAQRHRPVAGSCRSR